MSITINLNFSKSSNDINGDLQYQNNLIKYLNRSNYKTILGTYGFDTILSNLTFWTGKILIRIFKKNFFLNKYSHLVYRNYNYSFNKNSKIIFSHYFFPFFKKEIIIFSSMGVAYQKYFESYNNTINLQSDIYFHKYIDKNYKVVFLIWDKKFAIRTKRICNIKSPIKIIPPVLNIDEYKNNTISTKLSKTIRILFIGRSYNIKGLKYLLLAINSEKLKKYNFQLNIITSKKIDLQNKKINIYNNVNENFKIKLLKSSDIFVLPTLADTFGYSLLEAIAYKCAIITSNFYPVNKFCINNHNGFLVRRKNTKDILKYINLLLKNPSKIESFKKNSYKLYKKSFSQKIFKKKFDNLIKQINTNKILSDI